MKRCSIRSGAIAQRKRQAYLRRQEAGVLRALVPVLHTGGQSKPLFIPYTWEPDSSAEELDQTEYIQDPLAFLSRPLSQSNSEVIRLISLIPLRKGCTESPSAAGESCVEASVEPTSSSSVGITKPHPMLKATPKFVAASSSKGHQLRILLQHRLQRDQHRSAEPVAALPRQGLTS